MPAKIKDLTKQKFGAWRVIRFSRRTPGRYGMTYWWCRCRCGTERAVTAGNLRSGISKSCGRCKYRSKPHGESGEHRTPEYRAWCCMLHRCYCKTSVSYKNYGGRGIAVCERWQGKDGYRNFLTDMGRRPRRPKGMSLHRLRSNDNYEPDNCVWATRQTQDRNKRNSMYFTLNDVTKHVIAWADELGMKPGLLRRRRYSGWSDERALTTPPPSA